MLFVKQENLNTLKQLENKMTVIDSDEQRGMFGGSRLVGSDIWWTQDEFDGMVDSGNWTGGFVNGTITIQP